MLSEQRRRTVEGERRFGEPHGADDLRHGSRQRMRQLANHLAMANLRIVEHLGDGVDRGAGHAGGVQPFRNLFPGQIKKAAGEKRGQSDVVLHPRRIG